MLRQKETEHEAHLSLLPTYKSSSRRGPGRTAHAHSAVVAWGSAGLHQAVRAVGAGRGKEPPGTGAEGAEEAETAAGGI